MTSLDNLRCFVEAARQLNFRAAASAVALSPAAFGQRIRQLEDSLGCELFARTTRSVTLTQKGAELVPLAESALASIAALEAASHGKANPPATELVIGTRHELGMSWLMPLLPRLEKSHPWFDFHLYVGSGEDLLARVRSRTIDCAISSSRLTDPRLASKQLHPEHYVFVGASKLLAETPLSKPSHAKAHTLLDTATSLPLFRYWRDAPGGVDSLKFGRVTRLGTIAAVRLAALSGAGVCVLPEYFIRSDLKAKRLRRIMPKVTPLSDHFRLVFHADDPRTAQLGSLADALAGYPLR